MVNSPGPRSLFPQPPSAGPRPGPRRRTLDPETADQVHDQPGVRETAYVADALLVRGRHPDTLAALEEVAAAAGLELARDEDSSLGREVLESTFPTTYDASQSAGNQVVINGEVRRSLDPDNYLAGFAIGSGTSFAALQREFEHGDAGTDPAAAVARGRRVLDAQPQRGRP
jgi:hypothetical protein